MPDPHELAARHASLLTEHLPGVTTGVYLVGSVALQDYQPGRSDVDTVTVTTRALTGGDAAALTAVHAELRGDGAPHYDTTYVPGSWLRRAPDSDAVTPFSLDGELHVGEPAPQLVPPTWRELTAALVVAGPPVPELQVWDDPYALQQWTIGNLRGYWSGVATAARQALLSRPDDQAANADGVAWMVLGAPRLHVTLARGEIVSKLAAGAYAAERWPAHAALAQRCISWRAGASERFTTLDGLEAADLVDTIVADALRAA